MKLRLLAVICFLSSSFCIAQTLNEAIQHGLISNPDLLFNTAKSLTDKQRIDVARGANLPSVDVRAGYGREYSLNPTTAAIDGPGARNLYRTESDVELIQNLFAGGGIVNEVKRNEYFYQSQKLKTQGIAEDLSLEVTNRYFQILLHEKLYALAKTNYQEHQKVFSLIKERHDAGLAKEAELDQANSRLALAESNKISALSNLNEMRIMYAKVVGSWPTNLSWPKAPKRSDLPQNLGQAIEIGMEHHPTVKASYADIKEAKAQYLVARSTLYPRVDAVLAASKNRNLSGLIGPNDNRLAMVRMNYNIFRGGSDVADIKRTVYQVQEAYEVKNQALIDLKESLRLSWNAWIYSGLRLQPLDKHVLSARKTRSAYIEQFKLNKRTLLDLLDSQNEYYTAQLEYVRGKVDETYSRYRILNGMGKLLYVMNMRLPENVVNNDVFTSAQTHILLKDNMNEIPYPATVEGQVSLDQPVKNIERVPLTPAIVHKNTSYPTRVIPGYWYVSAGFFHKKTNALQLNARLVGLGFTTFVYHYAPREGWYVLLGSFEYRGQAANGMTRLKEVAKVPGMLVTFKDEDIASPTVK